ncbi:MAG: hypothetical protein NVS4B3_28280 [Gemmatimonadaceae bacterium]
MRAWVYAPFEALRGPPAIARGVRGIRDVAHSRASSNGSSYRTFKAIPKRPESEHRMPEFAEEE